MLSDFIAFDIEMPNQTVSAISAIGITWVKDGEIKKRFYTIVDPQTRFSKYVVELVKITPEMVVGKPTLPRLWKEIKGCFEPGTVIVSHGAYGDILNLALALERYGIKWDTELSYLCTCDLSLAENPELERHSLDFLCEHFEVELSHHNAQSDSDGCAMVLLKYIQSGKDVEKYIKTLNTTSLVKKHHRKRFSGLLKKKKAAARASLAKATDASYDFERHFYPFFEKHGSYKKETGEKGNVSDYGVSRDDLRLLAGSLTDDQWSAILSQRKFACADMYRLYYLLFNEIPEDARNFYELTAALPSFEAAEGISTDQLKRILEKSGVLLEDAIAELAYSKNLGYSTLALKLIKAEQLAKSSPMFAMRLLKSIVLGPGSKEGGLLSECAELFCLLASVEGMAESLIEEGFPRRLLNKSVEMAKLEGDRGMKTIQLALKHKRKRRRT